jgi:predicted DNA-binding transcriptional regulator AlpA
MALQFTPSETPRIRRLLTLPEAAEAIRRSPAGLRWLMNQRKAPPHAKIGGRVFFDADELAAWIDAQFAEAS